MTSIEQMAMKAVKAKWAARKEAKAAAKADKADKAAAEPPVADDEPEEKADKSRMGAFIRRLEASILEEKDGLDEEGLAVLAMMSKKYATERLGNDPELAQRVVRAACVSASASATIEKKAEAAIEHLDRVREWRRSENIDGILAEKLPNARVFHRSWPMTVHGSDKFGHLVFAERLADINHRALRDGMELEEVFRHRARVHEAMAVLKRREAAAESLGRARADFPSYKSHCANPSVYRHIHVVDLAGVKASYFTGGVRSPFTEYVKRCNERYPDALFCMWLVNATFKFKAAWAAIRQTLPRATREKIRLVTWNTAEKWESKLFGGVGGRMKSMPTWVPGGGCEGVSMKDVVDELRAERTGAAGESGEEEEEEEEEEPKSAGGEEEEEKKNDDVVTSDDDDDDAGGEDAAADCDSYGIEDFSDLD